MIRGGRRKNKRNQQGVKNTVSSLGGTSDEWTGSEEEKKTDDWENAIERAMNKWRRESARPGGRMHESVSQPSQVGREIERRCWSSL